MSKTEYEGIAFSKMLGPDGVTVSVTERAESSVTAYANLMETLVVMKADGFVPFESYYNKAQENITPAPSVVQEDDPFPYPEDIIFPCLEEESVVDAAKDLGGVELVDYFKKAGEWKTGDTQSVLVDQYKMGDGKIAFYREGNEYPLHTHYLNEVGVSVMAKVFTDEWDKHFKESSVPVKMPGGPFVITVQGGKVRTSGQGAGNVFRNFVAGYRP